LPPAFAKSEKAIAILAAAEGGHLLFAQHPSAGKEHERASQTGRGKSWRQGRRNARFRRGRLNDGSQVEKAVPLREKTFLLKTPKNKKKPKTTIT